MPFNPSPNHSLKRYLTPFLPIALGVVFSLALSACGRPSSPPLGPTITPTVPGQTAEWPSFGTQALTKRTATPLPRIPATPDESTPSPLGVTAVQLHGAQVSLWYPWGGAAGDSFRGIIDEFNRSNQWGIQVAVTGFGDYGSLDDAMEAALPTGTLPDIVVDYAYQARSWDAGGLLVNLTPYVEDPVWGLDSEAQADFYPAFWSEDLMVGGDATGTARLGIPYYRSAYLLFYNQTWAEELGYHSPPATSQDFRLQACAAAEAVRQSGDKTNLGKGGWLVTPNPGALAGWIFAFGGNITSPDGAGYQFSDPATVQAFEYLKGLQDSNCAWTGSDVDVQTAFENRQALFVVGSLADIPSQMTAFGKSGSTDNWVVVPFPSNTQPVIVTYGPDLFIAESTPERQLAAWLVLEWLVYPPNQAEFVQALGGYPTRQSTLRYLIHTQEAGTQWAQSLMLLPEAHGEPTLDSWSMMRWALSDAASQLFSQKFMAGQIPELIANLDGVAQEIIDQVR